MLKYIYFAAIIAVCALLVPEASAQTSGKSPPPMPATQFPIGSSSGTTSATNGGGGDDIKRNKEKLAIASAFAEGAEGKLPLHFMRINAKAGGGDLEIAPQTQTVSTSKRFVIVAVKCEANVGWFVTNDTKNQPVEWFELPGLPFIMVFPNNVEETINVYAYTSINNRPLMAKAEIKTSRDVPGPGPSPTPGPTPDPTPTTDLDVKPLPAGSPVNFTIIHDTDAEKANPHLADLLTSPVLIKGLRDRSHARWALDINVDANKIKTGGFEPYLKKVGQIPMYIIQDDRGLVLDFKPLIGTPQAILATVDKLAPPR